MRNILFIVCCFMGPVFFTTANAAFPSTPDSVITPGVLKDVKLSEVIHLSAKEFYKLSGRKPGFKEKLAFPLLKINMKKAVAKNPEITLVQYLNTRNEPSIGRDFLIVMVVLVSIVIVATLLAGGPSFTL